MPVFLNGLARNLLKSPRLANIVTETLATNKAPERIIAGYDTKIKLKKNKTKSMPNATKAIFLLMTLKYRKNKQANTKAIATKENTNVPVVITPLSQINVIYINLPNNS